MWKERWNRGEIYLSPSLKAHFARWISPCEMHILARCKMQPLAMLSQIHHHLGISPPPPQEPHPWLDISISILYMFFFVYVHVLYSEIVCTSCLYLVLNSLSLYKHLFFVSYSSLTFLMVFESCGCTHTLWIPHHHKVYHSFLVFFDRNIGDNVHLGWGESWGSKYFLF